MTAAPSNPPRLLVVDDEPDLRTLYELTLLREGYDVESAGSVEEGWALLTQDGAPRFQLVITDMRLPDGTGLDLLRRLEETGRNEKAVVITAYGSPENAVEALKAGAYDYLTKPVDLRQFRAAVASALGRGAGAGSGAGPANPADAGAARGGPVGSVGAAARRPSTAADTRPGRHPALQRMVGESAAMQQVRALVEKVARSMAPVLVQGESGTGKELVARGIHDISPRGALPFVAVNCGAIPEALLESEFFGYRKGAFTGAQEDRGGFFQAAQGGTLFLDEIGEMPLSMQSKLLRAIQERAVRQIGAAAEVPVNVRIVSATHKDLAAEVQAGRFRQDLYYRLNVICILVPPLRERLSDLPAICEAALRRIAHDAGVPGLPTLSPQALQQLERHGFPGNVRELENLLHRALALSGTDTIEGADLGLAARTQEAASDDIAQDIAPVAEPSRPAATADRSDPAPDVAQPADLVAHLDAIERSILEQALQLHRYNRTAAGASLGLSLRQMRYRMARLNVGPGNNGAAGGEVTDDRND
ncbi:MAG: sigma-54 dependent transcriptional regulator [Rubrivivax sp.]